MATFVGVGHSFLVMMMLVFASGWIMSASRRTFPSQQKLTGALVLAMIAMVATQVLLPIPSNIIDLAYGNAYLWLELSAAPIVITLAFILAGLLEGFLCAASVPDADGLRDGRAGS